ncbi:hypothetical protein CCR80_06515 [Rhodothalassium salexigens]|uniref:hypothetical protein n=1 Tax=Rhodothalassium salexigens TaxID=1086 RepID=UPI001912FEAD|nr:hypothetical protein [Rhodothalassium salexigens]MBK5920691.1 hypothetical protein [Rhodothalassium salexigens]
MGRTTRFVASFAALAGLAGAGITAADAQQDAFSDFYACDTIDTAAERLACFDAVMKKQKLIRGIRDGSAASAAANRTNYKALRSGPVQSAPLDRMDDERSRTARGPVDDRPAAATARPRAATPAVPPNRARAGAAVVDFDDLEPPHETTITGFNKNDLGDFKLRIAEGLVFKSAGGPKLSTDDLTNTRVTLVKNFLGQWRMRVPGESQPIWLSPAPN